MATTKSFTATGAGLVFSMKVGESFTYAVTGTFEATWILETSPDQNTWSTLATDTTTGSGTIVSQTGTPGAQVYYRFSCTAFTSGTMVTAITAAAVTIKEYSNAAGTSVFKITNSGITVPDIQATTLTSATSVLGAATLTTGVLGIGASTAAAGTTTTDAGVLPAGTGAVYPTTAADDTKGVRAHASDKVTGRVLFIGNGVSNKILKVYPVTGGTINGAAANAAFSSVSGKGVVLMCLSSADNTWLAW